MGFLSKTKELFRVLVEENEINIDELTDQEREDVLKKYTEGYKEFCKADSNVKSSEQVVKDYTNLVGKMEKIKGKTVDIRNVMSANTRAAMMKYHPETENNQKPKSTTKKEPKTPDMEIGG